VNRRLILLTTALACGLALLSHQGLFAQEEVNEERLIQALSDSSFKVRLQAAILVGKHRVVRAGPLLKKSLLDENDTVKAAAALSLGKIGNPSDRTDVVTLLSHPNALVSNAAEKALILFDEASGRPVYLVVCEPPVSQKEMAPSLMKRLVDKLQTDLASRSTLVLGAGEEKALPPPKLDLHLKKRSLTGILLRPKVTFSRSKSAGGVILSCEVSLMTATLVQKRMEFSGTGEASAEVENAAVSGPELEEIQTALLDASVQAASEQVIRYLDRRTGP
jgi:hypothetical protein